MNIDQRVARIDRTFRQRVLGIVSSTTTTGGSSDPAGTAAAFDALTVHLAGAETITGTKTLQLGATLNTAPSATTVNGVASHLLVQTADATPSSNAITVKRPSMSGGWGDPGVAGVDYGEGQAFELLSGSSQTTSDLTGDGVTGSNNNPVLTRIAWDGGLGIPSVHIAPGLRDSGGAIPTQGIWVDPAEDVVGIIIDNPTVAENAATPTQSYLVCRDVRGTAFTLLQVKADGTLESNKAASLNARTTSDIPLTAKGFSSGSQPIAKFVRGSDSVQRALISYDGHLITYADNGSTAAAAIAAGNAANASTRAIFSTINAGVVGVGIVGAASQTADYLQCLPSGGNLLCGVDETGAIATYDDAGTTALAVISAATSPALGSRANFAAGGTGVVPLAVRGATSQTADLVSISSGGVAVGRIDKSGYTVIKKVGPIADADLGNNELVMWWDQTNSRVAWKGKTVGGVVKTGTLALV